MNLCSCCINLAIPITIGREVAKFFIGFFKLLGLALKELIW